MKRATSLTERFRDGVLRIRPPRLPDKVEFTYGGLIRTGFWLLAFAWFWAAGNHVHVGTVFNSGSDTVRNYQISICRSYQDPTARGECVTRYLVGASDEKFYRVAITFLPPLLLFPLCGAAIRRMGKTAARKHRIQPL